MRVTTDDARAAWVSAVRGRDTLAQMIADAVAAGRGVTSEQVAQYRQAVAAEQGLGEAYDRHMNGQTGVVQDVR